MTKVSFRKPLLLALATCTGILAPLEARAAVPPPAPLHRQIDQWVAKAAKGPLAPRASDEEFLRRVYLDLTGSIPTAAEARAFLAECASERGAGSLRPGIGGKGSGNRLQGSGAGGQGPGSGAKGAMTPRPNPHSYQSRARLIDRLLASPHYARRMEEALTVALLERRTGNAVPAVEWSRYLRESFAANKPWDQLVRELVAADTSDPRVRPALRFFVDGRQGDPHRMTQDVARLFLGMNLGCAQCHDHPTVNDYKQAHYFGLYAYLGQSKLHKVAKTNETLLAEGAPTGKVEFASVFTPDAKLATGPRLLGGMELAVPTFEKGQEFAEPPRDGLPGVPKFRARQILAKDLTASANRAFVRTSVNRFWFLMLGRGLVHPLDMDHSGNPPSHPELLDLLTREFATSGLDVKRLLREIALSETYQRSSRAPRGVAVATVPPQSYRLGLLKPLSAEQMAWSVMQATGTLPEVVKAAVPEKSRFIYKDYSNGLLSEPPANLPDTMELFAAVFGNPPGEPEVEFQPSMSHSLFLMNEKLVLRWLEPRGGNLVDRLQKLADPAALAEELYLSVLTRRPTAEESAEVATYLEKHAVRRAQALGELAWALLASAEFRLNH